MITQAVLEGCLPRTMKSHATQALCDKLNQIPVDPLAAENIRDNFVSYSSVLKDGSYKLEDYMNAVAYCSFKLMGYNNKESYLRTFPQRYNNLKVRGVSDKDIAAYISAYNRNKLVNAIMEQSIIPAYVLNQDIHQRAIQTQHDIMVDPDVCSRDRVAAANSLLMHLKQPEAQKVSLEVGIADTSGLSELKNMMNSLATQQLNLIGSGVSTQKIAEQKLEVVVNDYEDGSKDS